MLRTAVFFGGCSSEKEISLESGRHAYNTLDRTKYDVIPIFVDSHLAFWKIPERLIWMNATADIEKCLALEGERIFYEDLPALADFCFLGLHGTLVEDGALQGLLELLGLPYNGPRIIGAAIGMDKAFQKELLKAAGIKFPPHVLVTKSDYSSQSVLAAIEEKVAVCLGFPCIVKPACEGCSTGLSKVNSRTELRPAIAGALNYGDRVLIEKFMDLMEVTCTVLGNEEPFALLPTETPRKGDFLTVEEKFLPGDAQMITPPRVSEEDVRQMQRTFVEAYRAMSLSCYARIDGFWDVKQHELYINEPNTLPGITPSTHVFHQAAEAGMTPAQFLDRVIEFALAQFARSAAEQDGAADETRIAVADAA